MHDNTKEEEIEKEIKHNVRIIELEICSRAITSGTRCTNCRASMEWLAVTRCPCRLVSTSSGSTYAEKYARYVEFRLSFSALRLFPEPLSLSFSPYTAIYTVAWLAREAPIPRTTEEYPFAVPLCNAPPLDALSILFCSP